MECARLLIAAVLLLLLGDFVATFGYHVPEHVFGKFHSLVHHSSERSFVRYAIKNRRPLALIYGFLSAFPYFMFIPLLWKISPWGVALGLFLAELHVIWRHRFFAAQQRPAWLSKLFRMLHITTPERHWIHHQYANQAFGDIFAFYGKPAEWWLKYLRSLKRRYRMATR
ncbi:MAG: sterol desaturase family protein [Leptolyngbyaceae cyanobacterium]